MNKYHKLLNTPYEQLKASNEATTTDVMVLFVIQDSRISHSIPIDNRIDEECKRIIDTFNDTLKATFHPIMTGEASPFSYSKNNVVRDFSQLVNSLAKVIEIELNNSVVKMLRRNNRNKSSLLNELTLTSINEKCVANKLEGTRSLMLGDIFDLLNEPIARQLPKEVLSFHEGHKKEIKLIKTIRNEASHTVLVGESRFLEFYETFCLLLREGWFILLMDLKEEVQRLG